MASSVPAPVEAKEAFLFSPEWTTGEELRLLEGIEEFGYGNWYVSNPQFVHTAECLPWWYARCCFVIDYRSSVAVQVGKCAEGRFCYDQLAPDREGYLGEKPYRVAAQMSVHKIKANTTLSEQ